MSSGTDTAVERQGDGSYRAVLEELWSSLPGIDGGYTAAVTRMIEAEVADPGRPRTRRSSRP